jgi:type IX secretion system PorP/SprF family membrane protein
MKLYLFLFVVIILNTATAQDALFSQYHNNMIYLNPAFAGSLINPTFSLSYRNQWPQLEGDFKTGMFSYHQYVPKLKGGIGAYYLFDAAGSNTITTHRFNLVYAPHIEVSDKFVLKPAITGGYIMKHLDRDNLTFGDMIDPRYGFIYPVQEVTGSSTTNHFDLGVGLLAYSRNFYGGYSVDHVTEPNESFTNPGKSKLPRKHTVNIGGVLGGNELSSFTVNPDFIYIKQRSANFWQANVTMKYNYFLAELSYRERSTIIFLSGIQTKAFKFSYSYDMYTKLSSAMDAHEVSISYKILSKPKNVAKKPLRIIAF